MFNETFTLSNGITIPKLGLGTWLIDDEQAEQAVRDAVSIGYRHIDTAQAYGNETGVGKGIRSCDVAREQLFITTKVAAEAKSYDAVAESIDGSLARLGLDYIDLLIIHSPQPWKDFREENRYFEENQEVWKAMEDAYKTGKVKAIGLSNFLQDDIANILASCEIKPMVNQVLAHVSNTPFELIAFCQNNDILIEAYSPIAHGAILNHAEVKAMADHLKNIETIKDYGEHSFFPVFGGKLK